MTTVEENKMSDMERGFPSRKFNHQDTTKIKTDIATKISEYIKQNEGEEAVRRWNKNSIYKVPVTTAAVNPEAFTPKMVSMGPYHHGEDQLKRMEVHKHRAARCFFGRSTKPIEDYIEALWKVLPDLMDSYSQLRRDLWMEKDNGRSFLTLMLVDGCFLLEMLNVYNKNFDGYEEHDPYFSDQGTISNPQIASDLMMLENQVPFTAIETILTVQGKTPPDEICKNIKNLMSKAILGKPHPEPDASRGLHMLDIVRKAFVVQDEFVVGEDSMTEGQSSRWPLMERHPCKEDAHHPQRKMKGARSVMALRRAGVEFKVAKDDSHSSIEFENGTLTIPINQISVESEIRVCNMVAFEHLHPGKFPSTLCYYTFMNGLLNSVADVKHLRSKGIITGTQSRNNAIFETFKKHVPGNVPMHPQYCNLHDIQDELNKFYIDRMTGCKGKVWEWIARWKHRWIPLLKKRYLRNPWTIISLVGATILLALTMAQTYYAARTYLDASHKKN